MLCTFVAHKVFQRFASYMESTTISVILDKLLTNMALASGSGQLVESTAAEILVNLQLENYINYFTLSHSGFISLLNICNSCNNNELDKMLVDVLLTYANRPESKLTQSKNRVILTDILKDICQNIPSLSTVLNYQSETKPNLIEAISTDIVVKWITNPSVYRINIINLVIKHSKRSEHFATTIVNSLSDNISEANIHLYLPLIKSVTINQAKESEY